MIEWKTRILKNRSEECEQEKTMKQGLEEGKAGIESQL
jgi:hypothetical protein